MSKFAVIDFDTFGFYDVEEYEPIGIVIEDGEGGIDTLYTQEAQDSNHPRYTAMLQHLEQPRYLWDKEGIEQDWRAIFGRLVNQSYLGLKFRIGAILPDEITSEEAFELYVVQGEAPEDIPVSDERVQSGY